MLKEILERQDKEESERCWGKAWAWWRLSLWGPVEGKRNRKDLVAVVQSLGPAKKEVLPNDVPPDAHTLGLFHLLL